MGPGWVALVFTRVLLRCGKAAFPKAGSVLLWNCGSRRESETLTNVFPLKMLVVLTPGQNTVFANTHFRTDRAAEVRETAIDPECQGKNRGCWVRADLTGSAINFQLVTAKSFCPH